MFTFGLVALLLIVSYPVDVSTACISSCAGQADGDYSSCTGTEFYATCAGGQLYERQCPPTLLWDDANKNCDFESSTCNSTTPAPTSTPGPACLSDCSSKADGFYQSCAACRTYTVCTNETLSTRLCPIFSVWDDSNKACQFRSTTCGGVEAKCTENCVGLSDGLYQACDSCNKIAVCLFGGFFDVKCQPNMQWDDDRKLCVKKSPTCAVK